MSLAVYPTAVPGVAEKYHEQCLECLQQNGVSVCTQPFPHSPILLIASETCKCDAMASFGTCGLSCLVWFGAPSENFWRLASHCSLWLLWDESQSPAQLLRDKLQKLTDAQLGITRELEAQGLVAQSVRMRQALFHLYTAAQRGVDVLLQGESGTGKEQLARMYHRFRQCRGDLATLDCTTLDEGLAGSELFGHERGAFTSAHRSRDGVIADADSGTLFLDEIGDLPLSIQPKLLRAIQERQYRRVGGNQWTASEFGLVCASHVALDGAVETGRFRLDLYHRIAACVIQVPALRERVEDIVPLAENYFSRQCGAAVTISSPLRQWLCQYNYPGNVRELFQRLRLILPAAGATTACLSDMIMPCNAPAQQLPGDNWIHQSVSAGLGLDAIKERATREAKASALLLCGDSCKQAAQLLGVSERTLQLYKSEQSA